MSIDEMLESDSHLESENCHIDYYDKYIMHKCDIDLVGWNDGIYGEIIVNQDDKFLYYYNVNTKVKGALAKKYISEISISKSQKGAENGFQGEKFDFSNFVNKEVTLNLYEKGFFDGIIGEDKELLSVTITEFREDFINIEPGSREIDLQQVTKVVQR